MKRHRHLNLRAQVLLLLTLMFGIFITMTTIEQFRQYQYTEAIRLRQFRWFARWIQSEQHRHIALARQVAFLAMNDIHKGLTDKICRNGLVGAPGLDPEYGHLAIADPSGNISCNSIPWLTAKNVANQDYFKEAVKRVDVGVIREADNRKPGQYAAIKARAMRDRNGHLIKIILVAMDFSWIKEEINTAHLPASAHLLVVDKNGTLIAGSPNMDRWVDKSIADTPFYQQISTTHADTFKGTGFSGKKSYIISHPIDTASGFLRVILDIPQTAISHRAYVKLVTDFSISITAFIIILIMAFYWSHRYFLRKILALDSASKKLADGDWSARTGIAGTNELGQLAHSFDVMADALQTKEGELEKINNELYRVNRALRVLSSGNKALLAAKTEQELLDRICRDIVEDGGYHMARIEFMGAERDGYLHTASAYVQGENNEPAVADPERRSNIMAPILAAVREERILTINDTSCEATYTELSEQAEKAGCRSVIALPLHHENKSIGALVICAYRADEFGTVQLKYLKETAQDISFGIEMLRTRADRDRLAFLEWHHDKILSESLEDTLRAIALTIEMRDPYTAGHQRRVAELATILAKHLELDEEEIHGIALAGIVHDIGKINIPAEILSKPGRLTDVEYSLVKNHAEVGYQI